MPVCVKLFTQGKHGQSLEFTYNLALISLAWSRFFSITDPGPACIELYPGWMKSARLLPVT